jgi:hypothetical protein
MTNPQAVSTLANGGPFVGGKVIRVLWFPSRDEALEAAGLSE